MNHPELDHSLTFKHGCGGKWQQITVEWPSKILVCPTCSDILLLTDEAIYRSIGTYGTYKEKKKNG